MSSETVDWGKVLDGEIKCLEDNGYQLDKAAPVLTGICLSGGGVRSAVFCGGVVGYLAQEKLLGKFHYLSTVSGGGYTGAALSHWKTNISTDGKTETGHPADEECPFNIRTVDERNKGGASTDTPNEKYIAHLRAHANYLMPNGFSGALVGVYVVLRSVILNLFIWIGLFAGLFAALNWLGGAAFKTRETAGPGWSMTVEKLRIFFEGSGIVFGLMAVFGALCFCALIALLPYFSLKTYKKTSGQASRYEERKWHEHVSGRLVLLALLTLPIGLLPFIAANIEDIYAGIKALGKDTNGAAGLGVVGAVVGTAASVFGFFQSRLGGVFGKYSSAVIIIGAMILIYATALLAMVAAQQMSTVWLVILTLSSATLAWFCSINDVSLGRFYRDRLMEAFMPDREALLKVDEPNSAPPGESAHKSDKVSLLDLEKKKPGPIHLINTNLVSWAVPNVKTQRRRGDNFVLSPHYCGSETTGWRETKNVCNGKLTLATAMATSGAAVNPQGGFAGQGPTTSPAVSVAMALLSLRLGYWLRWKNDGFGSFGNHFFPSLWMLVKQLVYGVRPPSKDDPSFKDKPPTFLELSDGGHFDNLGLYELIRRRCRIMVVCDGGHDPDSSYDSLAVLVRRVRQDFGADVQFDIRLSEDWGRRSVQNGDLSASKTGPQDLVARPVGNEFPAGVEYAEKGYFLASVTYHRDPVGTSNQPKKGLIIYMKSTLIRDIDLTTKGYKGANRLFPHDPTSNQFFTPEQFEAYRDLGARIAKQMDGDLVFEDLFEKLTNIDAGIEKLASIKAPLKNLERFMS